MENTRIRRAPVLVAVVHEVLGREVFAGYADLAEALKCRAARLRIPYDSAAIGSAVSQVEHALGRLVVGPRPAQGVRSAPPPVVLSRAEAKRLYDDLMAQCGR